LVLVPEETLEHWQSESWFCDGKQWGLI
jgi:hypothetical protein